MDHHEPLDAFAAADQLRGVGAEAEVHSALERLVVDGGNQAIAHHQPGTARAGDPVARPLQPQLAGQAHGLRALGGAAGEQLQQRGNVRAAQHQGAAHQREFGDRAADAAEFGGRELASIEGLGFQSAAGLPCFGKLGVVVNNGRRMQEAHTQFFEFIKHLGRGVEVS